MKSIYVRIITITLINLVVNYLLLYPAGNLKYIQSSNLYVYGLSGIVISLIPLVITLLFYKFIDHASLRSLKFTFNKQHFLYTLISIVLTIGMYIGFYLILSKNEMVVISWEADFFAKPSLIPILITVGISWFVAAFYEEVFFRGYMVANLKHLTVGKLYLVSSIVFAVFHFLRGYDVFSILIILSIGMTLMYVYLKSGSIITATITHFILNFTTGHLVGTSEISLVKIVEQPTDLLLLIPYPIFIVTQIALVNIVYRKNTVHKELGTKFDLNG